MEYSRFLAFSSILIISALTIYVGCRRSYAIYFFERESRRVVFLEPWSAAAVPIALSFILIISYLTTKRSQATTDELTAKKLFKSSQTSLRSAESRKFSRSSDLESIPESPTEVKQDEKMDSITESESGEEDLNDEENSDKSGGDTARQTSRKSGLNAADQFNDALYESNVDFSDQLLENLAGDGDEKEEPEADPNIVFTLHPHEEAVDDEWFSSRKSSLASTDSQREQHRAQRKQSEVYKQIGKIDLVPMSLKKISFQVAKPTSLRRFRKDSLFDVFVQLIGIHLPIWLSVIAVYITLVEILNMKFYTVFYYHHPGLKLIAMMACAALGLFHEWKPTCLVNNILGIAGAYVVIARVQTVSYVAGLFFLTGMVLFDVFWMFGIDLLSTVTKETRAAIMIIIPWGGEGKKEMLATLDIIVPGVFLNIVLKFADMYDSRAFFPSFYAALVGLCATFALALYRKKSTPAMVLPAVFAITASLLCVQRPMDLLRFEIKH